MGDQGLSLKPRDAAWHPQAVPRRLWWGVRENPPKSRWPCVPARFRARSGSVCQCRCWAGSQSSLCWRGKSSWKSSERGATSCGAVTFLSVPHPHPQRWAEHGQRGLGKLQPWISSACRWHGLLVVFWDWDSAPRLASTVNQPVPISGGPATATWGCHLFSLLTFMCGGIRDAAGSRLVGKIVAEQSAEPSCVTGFSTTSADPDVSSRHLSGDRGLACASALRSPGSPVKAISALAGAL